MLDAKEVDKKKLLILGGGGMLIEIVEYAKERGYYTIVTDYFKDSPAKQYADESWDISTAEVDRICEECEAAGVAGVFTAFDDFNVRMAAAIAEKQGFSFYTTPQLAEETMNKMLFKENCRTHGVSTMRQYYCDSTGKFAVDYPVIVKPVDSSGSRGISVCKTEADFEKAIELARSISRSGDILVEDYLEGDEIGANYFIQNRKVVLSATHDRYLQPYRDEAVRLPLAYVYPSKHQEEFIRSGNQSVVDMFTRMGLENGSLFLQGCVQNGCVSFYEMGYRLNAAKQYQIIANECGVNPMHALVEYSVNGTMGNRDLCALINPVYKNHYCTLSLIIKPGSIKAVRGLDAIRKQESTLDVTQWCFDGNVLPQSAKGTQKLIAARVTIVGQTLEHLAESIDFVNKEFSVESLDGDDLRDGAFDPNVLFI